MKNAEPTSETILGANQANAQPSPTGADSPLRIFGKRSRQIVRSVANSHARFVHARFDMIIGERAGLLLISCRLKPAVPNAGAPYLRLIKTLAVKSITIVK